MPTKQQAHEIIAGMTPWYRDINRKRKATSQDRTEAEQCFDSGVFVASEFIRRLTGNEELSLLMHECCVWSLEERSEYKQEEPP